MFLSNKFCHFDRTLRCKTPAMEINALDFVQGVSRKIVFSTMRAMNHGDILNDQQIPSFSMRFRNTAKARALSSANVTDQLCFSLPFHGM